jgi:hypothetical protein
MPAENAHQFSVQRERLVPVPFRTVHSVAGQVECHRWAGVVEQGLNGPAIT